MVLTAVSLLSAALLSAALPSPEEVQRTCREELGFTGEPTSGGDLARLRRCISTKRLAEEQERALERRLQRLDQHFWRHREQTEKLRKRSDETLAGLRKEQQRQRETAAPGRPHTGLLREIRALRRTRVRQRERSGSGAGAMPH